MMILDIEMVVPQAVALKDTRIKLTGAGEDLAIQI